MYRVLLERAAEKDLTRLSVEVHDRVIAAIQALAMNPRPPGCRKLAGGENDWRIRVGNYRVVYEIADEIRVVRVNRVRHRREVYRCTNFDTSGVSVYHVNHIEPLAGARGGVVRPRTRRAGGGDVSTQLGPSGVRELVLVSDAIDFAGNT